MLRLTISCMLLLGSTCIVHGGSSSWRPIIPIHTSKSILHQEAAIYGHHSSPGSTYDIGSPQLLIPQEQEQCALYKVSMTQQFYFEYIHYKADLPDMKEFTLCMWTKFHNHTNDHPLFSYAVGDQPRGILSWVANTPRSSYYMMNIDGHNLYRLNYPLRLNKWYHSCQSWNGHTGEWQIWVNDERVGRGFNNRLVGHVIKGNGIAISGQEQRQLGGGFLEGEGAPPGSGGMLGELTMVQLYNVALTAGKAHRDHKHHHAHHYEHETNNNVPPSTTRAPITGSPIPTHPFLTSGQINTQVKINPGAPIQIVQNGVTLRHPALPPHPESPPQPLPPINPESLPTNFATQLSPVAGTFQRIPQFYADPIQQLAPADRGLRPTTGLRFIDSPTYHGIFKRDKKLSKRENDEGTITTVNIDRADHGTTNKTKRETQNADEAVVNDKVKFISNTEAEISTDKKVEKRHSEKIKRGLLHFGDGLLVDDGFAVSQGLDNDYITGLTSYSIDIPKHLHEPKEEEREPAEGEVRQIMNTCDGCAIEPFEKALVLAWRSVPKKLYSGATHIPATPVCKAF